LDKTSIPSKIKAAKNSESVKQEIILEPLLKNYLVGLDVPRYLNTLSATGFRVEKVASQTFRLNRELNTRLKYTVVSQSYAITNSMDQDEKIYSWIPEKLTGNVRQLAAKWKKNSHGDEDYLHNILQYFTNNLVYTLEPGKFSKQHDFLNELLFNVKKGFCEHFASAFALLAREKGIPTRLVVGYHGGEFNPYGRYWMVRQKNAHVWVEVFLAKKGWMRIDPTFYIKPERIQSGHYDFDHYHLLHKLSFYPYVHTMALRFDDINTRWNKFLLWINVSFQEKVFKDNGALTITSYQLTGIIILSVLLSIFLLFIVWQKPFLKFMDESLDAQIVRIYKQGLKKIGNKHIVKQRSEGPHAFLRRIELKDKALALRLKPFFQTYVKLRYTDMQITRVHVKKLRSIVRQMRL
jgi:transglutaminase-like putative cysteine protease